MIPGSPQGGIEKTLTVKNEGTVAVTLTLSTAAPYSIVSVLPTLSPGQSAAVTVRFDPNESGNFTGNVQVGINGGQGSVSSSPLVGVAHKIEIDPAELDFGIVIIGNTREQKLTVKNQGVTTVPLAVSTEAPFSIASESSLILAPSESHEVTVQFSPTASGDWQRMVRLTSGTAFKEFPATGKAYTEEEYREILRQSILASCQATESSWAGASQGPRNIYFIPGIHQDFLFYRMPCPTDEELDALLEFLMAIENPTDDIILEQLTDQMRDSLLIMLDELLGVALAKLATTDDPDAIKGAILDEYFKIVLSTDPKYDGFDEFLAMLQASPTLNVIAALKTFVMAVIGKLIQRYTPPLPGWASYAWIGANILYALFNLDPPTGLSLKEWQAHQFMLAMVTITAIFPNGENAIKNVIQSTGHQGVGGRDSRLEAMAVIVFTGVAVLGITFAEELPQAMGNVGLTLPFFDEFLKWVATAYGPNSNVNSSQLSNYMKYLVQMVQGSIIWEAYANQVGGFIAFAALAQDGWNIVGGYGWGSDPLQSQPISNALIGLHVVATNIIDGKRVAVFVHVEAKLGVSEVTKVANTIEQITTYARRSVGSIGSPLEGYNPVTVLIAFSVEPGAVDQLVTELQRRNLLTPVLILYPENVQGWKAECVGDCQDKKFLDRVAAAIAQALGTPYEGGSENTLGEMLSKLGEAMQLAQLAYLGMSPDKAWWLTYGICGADLGCILLISESLEKELEEQCGGPCPVPMAYPPAPPSKKQW